MPYVITPDACPKCGGNVGATVLQKIFGGFVSVRFCINCEFEETAEQFHERLLTP